MTRIVSVTELRRHFDRFIALVIAGDVLVITRYGKEIAMLAPCRFSGGKYEKDNFQKK